MINNILLNLISYFNEGGIVMWPLLFVSIWLWTIILLKLKQLYIYSKKELPLMRILIEFKEGKLSQQELKDFIASDIPPIWKEFFTIILQTKSVNKKSNIFLPQMIMSRFKILEHHTTTILVLSAIAPLLGLLGTVSGMIYTFDVIRQFGTGNPQALAHGISEALITTQTGLVIAIPGMFMGTFIKRRINQFKTRLEQLTIKLKTTIPENRMYEDNLDEKYKACS